MNNLEKTFVYVLEYSLSEIFYIDITGREEEDIEDILYEYGYQPDQCSWMVSHERITRIKQIK